MANEIVITGGIVVTKAAGPQVNDKSTHQFDLAGYNSSTGIQNIGTSTEQIVFPSDLAAEGISYIKLTNLGPTNFCLVGLNTPVTQVFAKLKANQFCIVPVYDQTAAAGLLYYAKADTGAINLRISAAGIP